MKKIIWVIAIIALVVIGVSFLGGENDDGPEVGSSEETAMPVPAPDGAAAVEEMIINDENEPAAKTAVFDVSGKKFSFSREEIRVKQGDTVTINFMSTDGFHDWVVDEFGAATERVNTGGSTSVTFTADKAGEYEFYCSVGNHRALGMVGKLIVE